MNREFEAHQIGEQLGIESVEQALATMEAYCTYHQKSIELSNEPIMRALQYEGQQLEKEERELVARLRNAPPPENLSIRRIKAAWYWIVTILLTVSSCYFALISLEPFRIGNKVIPYCIAVAVVIPFLLDQVLGKFDVEKIFKWLAALAFVAGLAGAMLLAVVRGNLFLQEFRSLSPEVVIDDTPASTTQPINNFYDGTLKYLQILMLLFAFSMELGAGLALHETWRMLTRDSEHWGAFRGRLTEVRGRLKEIIMQIAAAKNEPALFAARFNRDFYRAMLTRTLRSAMSRLPLALLGVSILFFAPRTIQAQTSLVIAVDLTKSVAVKGPDGITEFKKNIDAVTTLLARIPADTRLTIVGITDASFSRPDILLFATTSTDPGYFGERLQSAQSDLAQVWRVRCRDLAPTFKRTDIVGALFLASHIFEGHATPSKVLVILSDMRNNIENVNLHSMASTFDHRMESERKPLPFSGLKGVRVYILGAESPDESIPTWVATHDFWATFFKNVGAELNGYSVNREIQPLTF